MDGATPPHALFGAWRSTEAFGNTSLDWSQALKDRKARLVVEFRGDGSYLFCMQTTSGDEVTDITDQFRHIVAREGKFTADNSSIVIEGDVSGIKWTFQPEEDHTLRIRLEGAKRFGRCKGVDVIYFQRVETSTPHE